MNNFPLIDFQQVTYTYPSVGGTAEQKRPALREINLSVQAGEYLAILGHNGSGKSTLARHCNALLVPDQGQVLIAGQDTRELSLQRGIRETVGMIFQQPDNQIIATIVEDDIAWALAVRGLPLSQIRERVDAALRVMKIEHLRKQSPQRLSGGQRQRLAIAGVLAMHPRCIVADEATSQLDPLSRQEIVKHLHRLHREQSLAILHVTHLLEEAVLAERVLVMEQGRIVMQGPPSAIFADLARLRALKLEIPEPLELAARLRASGVALSPAALTQEAIAEELTR